MLVDFFDEENRKSGTIELPDKVFKVAFNPALIQQALAVQLSNGREPIAHVKDRSEVRGGGKKPWRQKHTGRARHGSTRSPLWVHGGVTFGPRNEKNYKRKINKKAKKRALFSILSEKMKDGEIKIIDKLSLKEGKTREAAKILKNFFGGKSFNVLFVVQKENKEFFKAAKNIDKVKVSDLNSLNVYDCLKYKNIFFEKEAVNRIENR